jgi:hypothetical protein
MLVADGGQLIRCPVHDIHIARRKTQGVLLFKVAESERVVSVAHLAERKQQREAEFRGRGEVNQERTAAYPGSFDPITNGHIDIIRHAARLVRLNELRQHPGG